MNSPPFPPLIDLRTAGWSPARVDLIEEIARINNEIVAHAALERLDLSDHVYSFPTWCDLNGPRRP
jgi:hypothetical protein